MPRITSISTPVAHLVGPGKISIVNGQLAYTTQESRPLRLDPQELKMILCYGEVGVSGSAAPLLLSRQIEVAWLSPWGHQYRGRLATSDPSATALRMIQHRAFLDDLFTLEWARSLVLAKINSQLTAARHYQRHGRSEAGPVLEALAASQAAARSAADVNELRGIEGSASASWFRLLGALLQPPWTFERRVRRPPTDPVNGLLSLGYTWLLARTLSRAAAAGLEIYLGGLHDFHPGRPSLACDLMEPLRLGAVDRWVLAICNRGEISEDDFALNEENAFQSVLEKPKPPGVRLKRDSFGRVLQSWEAHWLKQEIENDLEKTVIGFVKRLRQFEG